MVGLIIKINICLGASGFEDGKIFLILKEHASCAEIDNDME